MKFISWDKVFVEDGQELLGFLIAEKLHNNIEVEGGDFSDEESFVNFPIWTSDQVFDEHFIVLKGGGEGEFALRAVEGDFAKLVGGGSNFFDVRLFYVLGSSLIGKSECGSR